MQSENTDEVVINSDFILLRNVKMTEFDIASLCELFTYKLNDINKAFMDSLINSGIVSEDVLHSDYGVEDSIFKNFSNTNTLYNFFNNDYYNYLDKVLLNKHGINTAEYSNFYQDIFFKILNKLTILENNVSDRYENNMDLTLNSKEERSYNYYTPGVKVSGTNNDVLDFVLLYREIDDE